LEGGQQVVDLRQFHAVGQLDLLGGLGRELLLHRRGGNLLDRGGGSDAVNRVHGFTFWASVSLTCLAGSSSSPALVRGTGSMLWVSTIAAARHERRLRSHRLR